MRYVYLCSRCETETEETHSILDDPEISCPECGGKMARKPVVPEVYWKNRLRQKEEDRW